MSYHEYLHIENINNVEAEGLLEGTCYIFPKLDGTNASVWEHDSKICTGSRKRELSTEHDNAGFHKWAIDNQQLQDFFYANKNRYRLFGEWLVPHNLKTYKDNAWRKFYIFDVYDLEKHEYIPYTKYFSQLFSFQLNIIPYLQITTYPGLDYLMELTNSNTYLIKKDCGVGEGIVIKNYDFINKYGRFTYGKIVRDAFKQQRHKTKQKNWLHKDQLEQIIVDKYVTIMLCNKVYAKIANKHDGWSGQHIPKLLNITFHDLVTEEIWDILKKYKYPTINFKMLQQLCTAKVKELKLELF